MKTRFKYVLFTFFSAAFILAALAFSAVSVGAIQSGVWEYSVDKGQATINKYTGSESFVAIPSEIDGYPVTKVSGDSNKSGIFSKKTKQVTGVLIPDSVTVIGDYAFKGSTALVDVYLSSKITSIGSNAFSNCDSLIDVTIPDGVTTINSSAFYGCDKLSSVFIPESVSYIGNNCFSQCKKLAYVAYGGTAEQWNVISNLKNNSTLTSAWRFTETLPFEYDGDSLFVIYKADRASFLKYYGSGPNVVIPSEIEGKPVTDILANAFYAEESDGKPNGCASVASVFIPDTVTFIGNSAFYKCAALTGVTIPNGVTDIGKNTFHSCSALSELTIGCGVKSIGEDAFHGCSSLKDVTIPLNVSKIAYGAFGSCTGLTTLTLGGALTQIGDWAFYGCNSLGTVYTVMSEAEWGENVKISEGNDPLLNAEFKFGEHNAKIIPVQAAPASCTENGNIYCMICSVCGKFYSDENGENALTDEDVYIPALGHDFGEWILTTPPTCTDEGEESSFCARCGTVLTRSTDALGHDFGEWTLTTPPTCTETGEEKSVCTRCGTILTRTTDALGHMFGEWYTVTNATCTENGLEKRICSVCETVETQVIPSPGHVAGDPVVENRVDPTCTENGGYDSVTYCTVCGDQITRMHSDITALGHDLVHHDAKAPTCTETGWSAYDTCSRCDYTTYEEIPATGHVAGDQKRENEIPATCTASGRYDAVVYCTLCGVELSRQTVTVDALGHTPAEALREKETTATCTADGSYDEVVYCSVCGAELSRETVTVPALGHVLVHHNSKVPTCTEVGWNAYDTCTRCDYTTYEVIPATGHVAGDPVRVDGTAPTCTEAGSHDEIVYCSACGAELSREAKTDAALGHDLVHHDAKAPTCTEAGWSAYDTCSRCDYTTYEEFPATGHTAGAPVTENVVPATCTSDGSHDEAIYCSVCGTELSRETKADDALGHDLVHHEGKVPTCTEAGWTAYDTCSRCDHSTYEEIPAIGHDYSFEVIAPTCTNAGYTTYTCSRCGDSYVTPGKAATGHKFGAGGKAEKCSVCGEKNPNYQEPVTPVSFTDVPASAYYAEPVNWAVSNNITAGTGAGKFSPDTGCTRGQVVTFLWRAAGSPEPKSSKSPFSDVKNGDYYFKAVLWAVEKGVTSGTSKTTFSPDSVCTRGQIVTFLWRANGARAPKSSANPFSDVSANDYFYNAVLWAVENGITAGVSKTSFAPGNTCTRAQVVTFLYRAVK